MTSLQAIIQTPPPGPDGDWQEHVLAHYMEQLSGQASASATAEAAVEAAAHWLGADVCALVQGDVVLSSVGFRRDRAPTGDLIAAAKGVAQTIAIPGLGTHPVTVARSEVAGGVRMVISRATPFGFGSGERAALESMALGAELALRELEDGAIADEMIRQPAASAVPDSMPPNGSLARVASAARTLIEADVVAVRLLDQSGLARLVALEGGDRALIEGDPGLRAGQGLGRPVLDGGGQRLVVDPDCESASAELTRSDVSVGVITPIQRGGRVLGTLSAGFSDPIGAQNPAIGDALEALSEIAAALIDPASRPSARAETSLDPLTGLPGRDHFTDACQALLGRKPSRSPTVIVLDLDGYHTINEGLGQGAGDRLLGAVARRLTELVTPGDVLARLGADDFGILLPGVDAAQAAAFAQRLLAALRPPFHLAGRAIEVTASVGIGMDGDDAESVLQSAALALDDARRGGGNRVSAFEPSMRTEAINRLDLEVDLSRACERDQLALHYQPIFDLEALEPVAFEALIRWRHPSRGLIPPGQFIPIAERTGLIKPIGTWVLSTACAQLAHWQAEFPDRRELRMTVNISAGQLDEGSLLEEIGGLLERYEFDPGALTLEITESLLISDSPATLKRLTDLTELGIKLAVDDFGVGYSSLRYISSFPIDILKIDRSFVAGIDATGPVEWSVLHTIVDLARRLDLEIVAEGIEEPHQPGRLVELGCGLGQGLLLGAASPPEAASALLRRDRRGLPGGPPAAPLTDARG